MSSNISMALLKKTSKIYDVELPKGDVKTAAEALVEYFTENFEDDSLIACQACKKIAPEYDPNGNMFESCPYCGVLFDTSEAEEEENEEELGEDESDEETPKKQAKGKKKSAKDKATPAKKRGRPKKEKEEVEIVPLTLEEQQEYDEKIGHIKKLRVSLAKNAWQIGTALNELNDEDKLWKSTGCQTFEEFCVTKLDISRSGAYKYMLVAREFEEDQFLELGVKKGELIASAPEEHRETLIASVQNDGASHPTLKRQLNELTGRISTNDNGSSTGGKTLTLNSRIKEGNIEVPWLNSNTHKQIRKANVKTPMYAEIQLSEEIELIVIPSENRLGLLVNFRKIETTGTK